MSEKIMEIDEVVEVIDNGTKEKVKLPHPIKLYAAASTIKMVALTEASYEKRYYTGRGIDTRAREKSLIPRRVKTVKLPVSHDKIKFTGVHELFKYLLENKGYLPE